MTLDFPPRLGEHNELILGGLGYRLSDLQATGVI
jgi:crotonobetainyl-CoA:carnitine CoA-transferase CaiB-like acyl-CoA transferase